MKISPLLITITILSLTLALNACNEDSETNLKSSSSNTIDIIDNHSNIAEGVKKPLGGLHNDPDNSNLNNSDYFQSPLNLAGTGCPIGTSAVEQNADSFQVTFDDYNAGVKGTQRRTSCSLAAPIIIPKGYQITSISAKWQGVSQGKVEFRYKYFVAGDLQSNWHVVQFNHEEKTNFSEERRVLYTTQCGENKILRVASSISVKQANAYISVQNLAKLKVTVTPCDSVKVQ